MNQINILQVVSSELCVGCGVCISESQSSKMEWNRFGFLTPKLTSDFNSLAIKVCPFNPNPDVIVEDEDKLADLFLNDAKHRDDKIGRYENIYVGHSKEFRNTSSSGGLATYIFKQLLEKKIVDHLFIVKELNGTYQYQLHSNIHEIKKISKTRYIPVTLEGLFVNIDKIEGRIAISGVACFIKAIRLKQHYYPELREKIPFLVGIICGGLKSVFFTDYLAQSAGIKNSYKNQEYRIKDDNSVALDYSFGALDKENLFHLLRMREVGDMWGTGLFKSNACDFCDDVTTELADISLGDAWIDPYKEDGKGTNVIVTRSKIANELIINGIEDSSLSLENLCVNQFKLSQKGSFNHRHIGLKYRIEKTDDKVLPKKRNRLHTANIPLEFKIVQSKRMSLRKLSLSFWETERNYQSFDNKIKTHKVSLNKSTKLYHMIQRIKRLLGLKVM